MRSPIPPGPCHAGQGLDEAGQQPGERRAVGVGPVGHHRGEDRAAEPVQLLGGRSLGTIAAKTGIPKTSLHRYLTDVGSAATEASEAS
jgi:hypothetical protein